ncbi:MAG: large conductance mechanosensitive channel protein MscL [Candidatus Doudnabacteria bacterium]
MWKEFKEFAIRGSALELAVGVVIGAAFGQVVNSLVTDIINPIISIFTGHIYFANLKLVFFHHSLAFGSFLNALINFFIVAFAVFLVIKQFNRLSRVPKDVPNTKECPFCITPIALKATRCPNCTSQLS